MKVIAVLLAILALSTAQTNGPEAFLEGFAIPFGLQDATSVLINCLTNDASDVWDDLEAAISDMENEEWTDAINEFFTFLTGLEEMESSCQDGVEPYLTTFEPAIEAFASDDVAFAGWVAADLLYSAGTVASDGDAFASDIEASNYEAAGQAFGEILQIGLSHYISTN